CRVYDPKAAGALAARNPKRSHPARKRAINPVSTVRRDTRSPLSAGIGGAARGIEHAALNQPVARIVSVALKPFRRAAQPECVAPGIHVAAHSLPAYVGQRISQNDLYIPDGILFR